MGADVINSAHLNIIKHAKKYGKIIIGLFSDEAISEYKSLPIIDYDQRLEIISKINGIYKIIKQETWDYEHNLNKIKPNFLIHGDDWKNGIQKKVRYRVIKQLKKWNGKLVEIPYSNNPKISEIHNKYKNHFFNSGSRVSILKRLIKTKKIVKFIECHNPLTGLMIENLKLNYNNDFRACGRSKTQDGWILSSRCSTRN